MSPHNSILSKGGVSKNPGAVQTADRALATTVEIGQSGRVRLIVELPVRASRSEVWAAVSTVGGVNREVSPFVRMTDSTHGAHFDAEPWRVGAPVLWQLLFGFIPVDRHRVELVALPDAGGFRESSSSWWHRVWRHERTLLDDPGGGCIVRDDVEIEPRLAVSAPIVEWTVSQMFRRRHRYLRRRFG